MTAALDTTPFGIDQRRRRRTAWWWPPAGVVAGLALGAIARGWMRLLSEEPEFSWSGTLFIVGAFGVAGLGRSIAALARAISRRRWVTTPARIVGAVLFLPLFAGAGVMMLPTVALGASAAWRPAPRWCRIALAVLAALPAAGIGWVSAANAGVSAPTVLGVVLFASTYLVVIAALGAVIAPIPSTHP